MVNKMDQVSNIFNGFTNLMDQNIRGVQVGRVCLYFITDVKVICFQLGCYSVALVGLTVAIRKVRPVSINSFAV